MHACHDFSASVQHAPRRNSPIFRACGCFIITTSCVDTVRRSTIPWMEHDPEPSAMESSSTSARAAQLHTWPLAFVRYLGDVFGWMPSEREIQHSTETNTWAPASLPFTRRDGLCPTPLPTAETIRASTDVIIRRGGQTVVAVTPDVVVKYGKSTKVREGQTLLYLEHNVPDVPAPRLYAMYYDSGELFLVMQRMPGVQLDALWEGLSEDEKSLLVVDLRSIFDSLRRHKCPQADFFGAIDGGPVPHHLFFCHDDRPELTGPFQGEAAFNGGMAAQYKDLRELNNQRDFKARFYENNLDRVLASHKPTLTHSDVQMKNILARETTLATSPCRKFEIALVDWEYAGWYPDYWEYFIMFTDFQWDHDWSQKAADFLHPWPAECAMMKMMYTDLWF